MCIRDRSVGLWPPRVEVRGSDPVIESAEEEEDIELSHGGSLSMLTRDSSSELAGYLPSLLDCLWPH